MAAPRRLIVGVVGGSSPPDGLVGSARPTKDKKDAKDEIAKAWDRVTEQARELGRAIAKHKRGTVLLTGGYPRKGSDKVHQNAMWGAVSNKGLAVGILPESAAKRHGVSTNGGSGSPLLINSGLTAHERNFINGTTPDALIALAGGPGTLSEVLIAQRIGLRPVVFLNSFDILVGQDRKKLADILREALGVAGRAKEADTLAKQDPSGEHQCRDVGEALEAALDLLSESPAEETGYPKGLPVSKDEFEKRFRELVAAEK